MVDTFKGMPVVDGVGEMKLELVGRGKRQRCFLCVPDGTRIAERKKGKWVSIPGGPVVEDHSESDEHPDLIKHK